MHSFWKFTSTLSTVYIFKVIMNVDTCLLLTQQAVQINEGIVAGCAELLRFVKNALFALVMLHTLTRRANGRKCQT